MFYIRCMRSSSSVSVSLRVYLRRHVVKYESSRLCCHLANGSETTAGYDSADNVRGCGEKTPRTGGGEAPSGRGGDTAETTVGSTRIAHRLFGLKGPISVTPVFNDVADGASNPTGTWQMNWRRRVD